MGKSIDQILKHGKNTKIKTIDYSTPERMKQLAELKEKSERCLKNKETNWHKMSTIIINR